MHACVQATRASGRDPEEWHPGKLPTLTTQLLDAVTWPEHKTVIRLCAVASLGWPKIRSAFSVVAYGKTQMNFMANPTLWESVFVFKNFFSGLAFLGSMVFMIETLYPLEHDIFIGWSPGRMHNPVIRYHCLRRHLFLPPQVLIFWPLWDYRMSANFVYLTVYQHQRENKINSRWLDNPTSLWPLGWNLSLGILLLL